LGVMALILFSVSDISGAQHGSGMRTALLFGLSALAIVLNAIALSAIVFRISEWGFTPNRLAVLGSNALMLIHMGLLCLALYKAMRVGSGTCANRAHHSGLPAGVYGMGSSSGIAVPLAVWVCLIERQNRHWVPALGRLRGLAQFKKVK
jgi:hypothetical protein